MFGVLILVVLSTVLFYNFYWKRRKFPPGPIPIPLVGNALEIGLEKDPYKVFIKWHKKYGPVHTYWFGEQPIIAVTDFNLIKETFIKDADTYSGRDFFNGIQKIMRGGTYGVIMPDDDFWKSQRRFALTTLRNFGMGRNMIENTIMEEVHRMINYADTSIKGGQHEIDLMSIVDISVGSVINSAVLGYRFDNEQEFYRLKALTDDNVRLLGHPLSVIASHSNTEKWRFLPFFKQFINRLVKNGDELFEFYDGQIEKSRKLYSIDDENVEATNYVQAFLMEMKKRERAGNVDEEFSFSQLRNMLFDLWGAGQETTSTTLNFAILYLLTHQSVQEKLQKELDKVIGNDQQISLSDRPRLHYTNAVLSEIQRLCNLLPFNLVHKTTRDVVIDGYKIEKGTAIFPQISVVLFDEKIFPNPRKFQPERFLDLNGHFKKLEELIPFSVGKRQCLGESLAKDELFLFVSNLFHEFKVYPVDSKNPPTLEKINGFGVKPHPYKVSMNRRINPI